MAAVDPSVATASTCTGRVATTAGDRSVAGSTVRGPFEWRPAKLGSIEAVIAPCEHFPSAGVRARSAHDTTPGVNRSRWGDAGRWWISVIASTPGIARTRSRSAAGSADTGHDGRPTPKSVKSTRSVLL